MKLEFVSPAFAASLLAISALWSSGASAESFTTSSVTVTDTSFSPTLSFSSIGLNNNILVGSPLTINNFILGTITGTSNTDISGTISAVFDFTNPAGTETDSGAITANFASRNLKEIDISWTDPVFITFGDGSELEINLSDAQTNCSGNCQAGDTIGVNGTFTLVNGPLATPLPATLPLFAGGLGFVGYLAKRRKSTKALAAA